MSYWGKFQWRQGGVQEFISEEGYEIMVAVSIKMRNWREKSV